MTKSIHTFLDEHGRLTSWPSDRRRAHQLAILDHLKTLFEPNKRYTAAQVSTMLQDHSTLPEVDVLVEALVEGDYLATGQNAEGQAFYWRADGRPVTRL